MGDGISYHFFSASFGAFVEQQDTAGGGDEGAGVSVAMGVDVDAEAETDFGFRIFSALSLAGFLPPGDEGDEEERAEV